MSKILVTGSAGFIGFFLTRRLAGLGHEVAGVDYLTPYYSVRLKEARLALLRAGNLSRFDRVNIVDAAAVARVFDEFGPEVVVHLAAQPGVRHSLKAPHDYTDANVTGFLNVLEGCRHQQVRHLLFASSSSVYGANTRVPFSVRDNVDHPISLYAATKKANELMAHSYSHLFKIPTTGMRFFMVYGPWGRPDMAPLLFAEAILAGRPIDVFGEGNMRRDFTYVEDVVEVVVRLIDRPPAPDPAWSGDHPNSCTSSAPYRIWNVGNSRPVELLRFIEILEETLGHPAQRNLLPPQPGDVPATWADVEDLVQEIGYRPDTPIEVGVRHLAEWYREVAGTF